MPESRVIMDLKLNGDAKHWSADMGPEQQGAVVSFHSIHYTVKQGGGCLTRRGATTKDILVDLNGIMRPGLNAIMGPTGSGKSSFLDVLAARKDPLGLSGEVLIDGSPQPPNFKCVSGYVVQDDVLMGCLTVRENLTFSAALRLPESIPHAEKEENVNKLITELGLSNVADSKVGTQLFRGISGGERKRTSIGMELIINPSVLFLDEPTTGLDASTANSVLRLLKRMSDQGRTIILSIHQPRFSIYQLFDSLMLLHRGKQVYHGPAQSALQYFSDMGYTCDPHNNPSDFFLDIINGDVSLSSSNTDGQDPSDVMSTTRAGLEDKFVEEYRNSSYYKQTKVDLGRIIEGTIAPPPSRIITYNTSFFTQFRWVFKRALRNLVLNPQTYFAQVAVSLILSLVVGIIFFHIQLNQSGVQNRTGVLFFIIINQCFTSTASAEIFISERKLFIHEYISGYYRLSVYFLPKVLSEILFLRSIPSIIFSCVLYFMVGLKQDAGNFFILMFTLMLVAYTATCMTMAISADQSVVAITNIYITICFVFMMIFAGLLVNIPSVADWLSWLKYLSIPRYGFTALLINEFSGLTFCQPLNQTIYKPGQVCHGEEVLHQLGIEPSYWGLWQNHVALIVLIVLFLSVSYIKLRLIKKFT